MKLVIRGALWLMVATMLSACGGGTAPETKTASGIIHYYTIGEPTTMSSPWGDGTPSHMPAVAVKFTPKSYPITMKSVTIYAANRTGSTQLFNLYGYSDLTTESTIFSPVLDQTIPDTGSSYIAKTVAIPETVVSAGSFYIGVEWVTKPLNSVSGANSFFVITDSKLDYPGTNFMRFTGKTWSSVESMTNVTAGDLGIVINY